MQLSVPFFLHGWILITCAFISLPALPLGAQPVELAPSLTPVDNPLKGLVPYTAPAPDRFPHSMEFSYLAWRELMTGPDTYIWKPLDDLLDDCEDPGFYAFNPTEEARGSELAGQDRETGSAVRKSWLPLPAPWG